ncbi:MAG TPA: alanine racemase [Saprospiraceae bacterium]|nr:alanine racemase [Saprospiraceae bacterium]
MVPTFLIDEDKCRKNIRTMVNKANENHVRLRPHFKTHQDYRIGEWFREEGVYVCTVSSLDMALYFASHGWKDITVAFPANILEIGKINQLSSIVNLNVLVEAPEVALFLKKHLRNPTGIYLKIDVGTHRTGINPANVGLIDQVIDVLSSQGYGEWKGFLAHAGHSYQVHGDEAIEEVYDQAVRKMLDLKSRYREAYPNVNLSFGDTPTCSRVKDLSLLDEIRPGNFVYYDLMQCAIGSCNIEQVAVSVECPVVAIHVEREEVVVYGGAVHLSKERMHWDPYGEIYGLVARSDENKWNTPLEGCYMARLSQEHGIVRIHHPILSRLRVGDTLKILPVHSCLTAHQLLNHITMV